MVFRLLFAQFLWLRHSGGPPLWREVSLILGVRTGTRFTYHPDAILPRTEKFVLPVNSGVPLPGRPDWSYLR
jgi:hypothetical protein